MTSNPKTVALAAAGAVAAGAIWWRKNPSTCPYDQRFWVQPPHPLITRQRLRIPSSRSPASASSWATHTGSAQGDSPTAPKAPG